MIETTRKVPYSKELRQAAKTEGAGLITIAVETPDGLTKEVVQFVATARTCKATRWWRVLCTDKSKRPVPDLEAFLRELVES